MLGLKENKIGNGMHILMVGIRNVEREIRTKREKSEKENGEIRQIYCIFELKSIKKQIVMKKQMRYKRLERLQSRFHMINLFH